MNKHLYRIVFNRALGVFQAVSELARRPGHGTVKPEGAVTAAVRPVSWGLWMAFGWIGFASVASAQITADPNAPGHQRPTVLHTPGTAPLVNIQTPSAAGVSRNAYGQFNVAGEGAVLNNSRTPTQTQLAGAIAGNPWLATGTAKVILNEVTGAHPSQLNGYVEVAGDRAQVVIANPAGIACDGCGFINANRVTLTTGTPELKGGALDGYRVTGGAIQVSGAGLDASHVDYTDLIARSVAINAGLWSPQLQVTTGTNQVGTADGQVAAIQAGADKPAFALDVSALGGMYANKITLLGTEQGVGVRNAGAIGAQAGDLVVTLDGRLENHGSLQSQANTRIAASGGVANSGTLSATRELAITTPVDVDNGNGMLNAGRIAIDAGSLRNAGGTIAQTGVQAMSLQASSLSNRDGHIGMPLADADSGMGDAPATDIPSAPPGDASPGDAAAPADGGAISATPIAPLADGVLHITGLFDNNSGRISTAAGFDLSVDSSLVNDGGQLGLRQLTLAGGDLSNRGGTLAIDGAAFLRGGSVINDAGQLSVGGALTLDVQDLSNRDGTFVHAGTDATALAITGTLDNTGGTLASNASSLALTSDALINARGSITQAGTGGFTLRTGYWQGTGGTLATTGAAYITAGSIDHRDATLSAARLTLDAQSLDNRGGLVAASGREANSVIVAGDFDNGDGGILASYADLTLQANMFDNANGTVQHAGEGILDISANTLRGAGGTLGSNGRLAITGSTIDMSGGATTAQQVSITTGALNNVQGSLVAVGDQAMRLNVTGAFDNTQGAIATNGALQIQAQSLINAEGALTAAGSAPTQVQVADTFTNTGGTVATRGAATLQAGNLLNQHGIVQTGGGSSLTLAVDDLLDNSDQGVVAAEGDLTVTATTLDNTQGTLQHAGSGILHIDAIALDGRDGTLASNGTLAITGHTTDLSGGITQAQAIRIDTDALRTAGGQLSALGGDPLTLYVRGAFDNAGGTVVSNGALWLTATTLDNTQGTLIAAGSAPTRIAVDGTFTNTQGTFASAGATTVQAGSLINQAGVLQAADTSPLVLTIDGLLSNDGGTLQSNGEVQLTVGSLSNRGGMVQTPQAIHASVRSTLDNTGGAFIADGNLDVQATTLLNRETLSNGAGTPSGLYGQQVALNTHTFDNTQGQVVARDALAISGGALNNAGGMLDGQGNVIVTGTTLDNAGGQLVQRGDAGSLSIDLAKTLDNTQGGLIGAEGDATLQVSAFDNSGGATFASHDLSLTSTGDVLNRDGGLLQAGGTLGLIAQGALDNTGGAIDAAGAATLSAVTINNIGGQLLAGNAADADAALRISATGTIDNRGGVIGNRGGDISLSGAALDNSGDGTLVAQRDLTLDHLDAFGNHGGTTYATGNLSYQNGNATLDNTSGQLGAGDTAWLNLAQITNTGGHLQANTLWFTTPTLNNDGGEIDGTTVHATLASLNGIGRLYGVQALDAHVTGNYVHLAGQRLESDGILSLAVEGTLTNQGTLQTQGELDITATHLINQGTINASADDGSGVAHIVATAALDNQTGGLIEGDTLTLGAHDITNTGDITGNWVQLDASTLINGRDFYQFTDNAPYQSAFIAAAQGLVLYVSDRLTNRDATLYSQGNLVIAADASGQRSRVIENLSGDIEAEGNLTLHAQQFINQRRVIETRTFTLSTAEQAANTRTSMDPMYTYNDPLLEHQTPNIDPSQVLDPAAIAKAQAYCQAHDRGDSARCVHFRTGDNTDLPSNYQRTVTDTLLSVTTITDASAESRLQAGGDINLDGSVVNNASTIAAGRHLTINGEDGSTGGGNVGSDTVQNIAWVPTGLIQTTIDQQVQWQYLVTSPDRTWLLGDWWTYNTATSDQTVLFKPGTVPAWITYDMGTGLNASLTAGSVTLHGGDITNTVVGHDSAGNLIRATDLADPGNTALRDSQGAQAGSVAAAAGSAGHEVSGPARPQGAAAQTVGGADQPLPGLVPPSNALYHAHPEADAPFLVTTAPRFAKGASTSSDYLLASLGYDAAGIHKRLGDGYYEQNLVLDQILQLTGRKTLNGGDGLSQYNALMDGAASEAARLGLQLGAPLTTDQIAALSSDIVWLVDQVVNGEHVLVPVVYLSKATADRMQSDGALIAGDTVDIQSSGTVRNDGTLDGTQGTWLSADTLINTGTLTSNGTLAIATRNDTINSGQLNAQTVAVQAGRDLINAGSVTSSGDMALLAGRDLVTGIAPIQAGGDLAMVAGRDLTAIASTIRAGGDAQLVAGNDIHLNATGTTTRTQTGQTVQENLTHAVTGISAGGNLAVVAGNNLTSQGAQLSAGSQLGLAAGNDLNLNAVTDSQSTTSQGFQGRAVVKTSSYDEGVRGTKLSGTNGVVATAGHDLTATAATITSDNGTVALGAGHDLTLATAQETRSSTVDTKTHGGGLLSSSTTRTHDSVSDSYAIGTLVSGSSVTMAAGNDLTATAAQVVADHDIVMAAGHDLTLDTANDIHTEGRSQSKTKSGLMGAGIGVMVGQARQSQSSTLTQTTPTGTLVGSIGGSVTMTAGNTAHLTNATVLSDTGTTIVGKTVTIDAAVGTVDTTQIYKQSSTGLHVGLGGGVVSAAQATYGAAVRSSEVKDHRLSALYVARAAYGAYDTYQGASAAANALDNGSIADAAQAGGVSLQIGIGSSHASSQSQTHDDTAYGSTIHSNGNVTIAATGGDLNVIGSQISGTNVALAAANDINLLSQQENHTSQSSSKNSGAEIGYSLGAQTGLYVTASAGKGKAAGNGTTHAESLVTASDTLTLISGNDTNIIGAQAKGNTVLASIGGNLNIASEQDTDDYASKQQQVGGTFVYGVGGSASVSQGKTNSHYASVNEISGIGAGDGGYQIVVNGNTDLKGGVIVSTAGPSRNLLDTGSLSASDIENKANAKVSTASLSGDSSLFSGSKYALAKGVASNLLGSGSDSDQRSSTTRSGISEGAVVIRDGDTRALDTLDRNVMDLSSSNALKPIDMQVLQETVEFNQAVKSVAYQMSTHYTDEAYKTMFIEQVDVYEVVKDENGNPVPGRKLTEEEKMNLQAASDGKVHIAYNGIFNDAEAAEKYADQHSSAVDGPQYYAAFPKAGNAISELLVAGYQKSLENDFWGLTNATEETKLEMIQYGQSGLQLDGHSRGSMTIGNAMESLARNGNQGILSATTVSFFGPAYNAYRADSLLSYLQNRSAVTDPVQQQSMVLTLQNHIADPVGGGTLIGNNPSTGGTIPTGSSSLYEMWRAITGQKGSTHNCYGVPRAYSGCSGDLWKGSPDGLAPTMPINAFER